MLTYYKPDAARRDAQAAANDTEETWVVYARPAGRFDYMRQSELRNKAQREAVVCEVPPEYRNIQPVLGGYALYIGHEQGKPYDRIGVSYDQDDTNRFMDGEPLEALEYYKIEGE